MNIRNALISAEWRFQTGFVKHSKGPETIMPALLVLFIFLVIIFWVERPRRRDNRTTEQPNPQIPFNPQMNQSANVDRPLYDPERARRELMSGQRRKIRREAEERDWKD